MGGGPKPNSNVPILDVPKWLWRGMSVLLGTMSLNLVFSKASLRDMRLYLSLNKSLEEIYSQILGGNALLPPPPKKRPPEMVGNESTSNNLMENIFSNFLMIYSIN